MLAAIVFTDVAGFSTRVERDEKDTLALLERDFTAMRLFSATHSGTVIKSTGDGLMLYFTSAVAAVEWALKTQRHFAEQAAELPAGEVLRHRVGIHLGDVFASAGDLMGDGVNVAARVQAEARPGGICISQVVYGVVKNKLRLDVVPLEHRKLKNIHEDVRMYHVLLEPPAQRALTPVAPAAPLEVEEASASRHFTRNAIVIALLVIGIGTAAAFLLRAHRAHEQELVGSREMRDALGAALRTAPVEAAPAETPAPAVKEAVQPLAPTTVVNDVNFLALTTGRPPTAGISPAHDRALAEAREALQILDTWRVVALQRYTKDRPLSVRPLGNDARKAMTVFTDGGPHLYFAEGGAVRRRAWDDLKTDLQGEIVQSLLVNAPMPPTREVVRGAEAFAYVHGLPELAAVLVRQ